MFSAKIVSSKNFTWVQKKILNTSIIQLEDIFNSKKFKSTVINFKSPYTKKKRFLENNEYSNLEIYNELMIVAEFYVELDDSTPERKIIGYTYPSQKTIYTYKWWFDKYGKNYYAAHLAHEWCHKLGFDHTSSHKKRWKYTVPYVIGQVVTELIDG